MSTHLIRRRTVLAGLLALPLAGLRAAPHPHEGALPFALTSAARARTLKARVAPAIAGQVVKAARKDAARPVHLMAEVRTGGLLKGEGGRETSQQAQEDWRQARLQALAWRLSGEMAHFEAARQLLLAWSGTYQPSFSPVDETELASLLMGYDLVQERLNGIEREQVQAFCRTLAQGYLSDPVKVGGPSTARNNWHSHRIKIGTAAAYVTGDALLVARAKERFLAHVPRNIGVGGVPFDFEQRDALHYTTYSLEPLLTTALMAQAHGDDWYGAPEARRLVEALAWLAPYAQGKKTHEEFAKSAVPFDRKRVAAGEKGFTGNWEARGAANVYLLAARFDPAWLPLALELRPPAWALALYGA
ncbi:alginate lyase family protein [Janthinobacterium sp. GW460P]|uniref:alginate lyase family protein n=1 Tax=unclassified Janthinobacterium TaxID=2610881 RepID=UPI000A3211AB|nr:MULTISPECIES: alginate lyase family protein [unclassified Janthinobacterium]MCC7702522.1 alginate lyase family protein [Janthinobacterium sp. GW460P]MCC7708030.1 alginate lyase family protein [Janthinobacterium sp. GW460W]